MIGEVSIDGVFFPAWALGALSALVATVLIGKILRIIGLYRLVWHTGLFDLALFVVLWASGDALWVRLSAPALGLEPL